MPEVVFFEQCGMAVDNMVLPDGSRGKCLTIVDSEGSQRVYRYPMTDEQAKVISEKLAAPNVQVPSALEMPPGLNNGKGNLR